MLKTNDCGDLRKEHAGQAVTLAGWVNRRRDMGGVIFVDLRDRSGKTQVVVDASRSPSAFDTANTIRPEYVIQVGGVVELRPEGQQNPDMETGDIELHVDTLTILNKSRTPPIPLDRDEAIDEALRLKYRYLDLRRPRLQRNMNIRHKAVKFIRDFLDERGFLEIETPILFKSTPEGARDYLVPSRVHPGKFYALPQSPQQLKQLLMIAGYEKYFQIARCFRDEDQRADRQPEFTQLDIEASFVEREDILALAEELVIKMVDAVSPIPLASKPLPRLSYAEALERFGTDRPDMRFGMELIDVSDIIAGSDFRVFTENISAGLPAKAIRVPGCAHYSRKQMSELEEIAKQAGAKGLAWMAIDEESEEIRGFITKYFQASQLTSLVKRMGAEPGDLLLFSSDRAAIVYAALGALRETMAERLGYKKKEELAFTWIIDFPLFEPQLENGHYAPSHHMFTAPKPDHIDRLDSDPGSVLSQQYDLVCNGYEVGGGSIRIHDSELQKKIFSLIGFSVEEAQDQFGHMLTAFQYGAPPHGGIAPGIDRLVMLMAGEPNIREVIAFPKSQNAADLMADAPSTVADHQLEELHLTVKE